MAKEEHIEFEGVVEERLRGGIFRVRLNQSNHLILAHISGRIRKHNITILEGDRVTVEVSPYEKERGIISFRKKKNDP